jgi:hypothetical protein
MATCPSYYCGDEWGDLPAELCPSRNNGGISFMVLLRCGISREDILSDGQPYAASLEKVKDLIANNDAKQVPNIQVTIDPPSAVTGNTYDPCNPEQTITYDRTITIVDPNTSEGRRQFWDSVSAVSGFVNGGVLLYECDADRWSYIDASISFSGGRNSPENNGELQRFEITGNWRSKTDPEILENTEFSPADLAE